MSRFSHIAPLHYVNPVIRSSFSLGSCHHVDIHGELVLPVAKGAVLGRVIHCVRSLWIKLSVGLSGEPGGRVREAVHSASLTHQVVYGKARPLDLGPVEHHVGRAIILQFFALLQWLFLFVPNHWLLLQLFDLISFFLHHLLSTFDRSCLCSSLCCFLWFGSFIFVVIVVVTILPVTFCLVVRVWPLNDIFDLEFIFL